MANDERASRTSRDETDDEGPACARWRRLVADRRAEAQRLTPDRAAPGARAFFDRRADRYAAAVKLADASHDPFLRELRRVSDASSTLLDVGAGTGRFTLALALAGAVAHVTAVDPSAGMLDVLRRDAQQQGVTNVTVVQRTWEDTPMIHADVVFSAFVLTLVPDARPFLVKLDACAREHVVLYLGAFCADAVLDPLWRHFHGTSRVSGPSYLDAIAVLRELRITPAVKVVEVPNRIRFATIDEAVEHYRDALLLADSAESRRELEGLLPTWLLGRRGAYRSPLRTVPAAIVRWTPRT